MQHYFFNVLDNFNGTQTIELWFKDKKRVKVDLKVAKFDKKSIQFLS